MDHRARAVLGEDLVESPTIANVAPLQRSPLHGPGVAFLQRVETDRPQPGLRQGLADMAADIARAAGHQDGRGHIETAGPVLRSASARSRMVPGEGFEPPTFGLQNRCTTTVLTRHFY